MKEKFFLHNLFNLLQLLNSAIASIYVHLCNFCCDLKKPTLMKKYKRTSVFFSMEFDSKTVVNKIEKRNKAECFLPHKTVTPVKNNLW